MKTFNSTTEETEKDLAQTPWWFVHSLEWVMRRKFTLDACALAATAKARFFYSLERGQDGLSLPWKDMTFCNMPFSNILPWIEKAAHEADKNGVTSCLLFPDTPETAYARAAWEGADTIIRMPFRLQFLRPDGTPFLSKSGGKQGPQFPVQIAVFTPIGLSSSARMIYHDFRRFAEVTRELQNDAK